MRKRLALFIATLMIALAVVACTTIEVVAKDDNNTKTTEEVVVTMLANCYDKEQYKGTARIEQMFVEETRENKEGYFVTLVDTQGMYWEVINLDLYLYEEVLVLLVDNGTPEEVTDDEIVHVWVGLE